MRYLFEFSAYTKRFSACVLLAFIGACFGVNAEETKYTWRNVPIQGGGYVTGLLFHPHEKNVLYARTDVGGSYRWRDESNEWIALNDGTAKEHVDDSGILAMAIDPKDSNAIYLLAGLYFQEWAPNGALLRSFDRGNSWERISLPFKVGGNENGRGTGERLIVDIKNSNRLIIGSNTAGLWMSEDKGRTWTNVQNFSEKSINLVAMNESKAGKTSIIVATDNPANPMLISKDNGQTWKSHKLESVSDIVFHRVAQAGNKLYITGANTSGPLGISKGGVWRFDLDTEKWAQLTLPEGQGGFSGVTVDPRDHKRILVSTTNRWYPKDDIFLSEDGGNSWKSVGESATWSEGDTPYVKTHKPHWITDIQFDPYDSNRALLVTGYGVYESTNINSAGKVSWRFVGKGMEETVILELISPPTGASLLSVMGDIDGFLHDDLTKTPAKGRFKPELGSNNSIAYAFAKSNLMARTVERGNGISLVLSADGGKTWQLSQSEPEGAFGGQVALSAKGDTILWTPHKMGSFFSRDGGKSWSASKNLPANLKPIADTVANDTFYAYDGEQGTLFLSRDGGQSFTSVDFKFPVLPNWRLSEANVRAVPGLKGEVYVSSGSALYRIASFGTQITQTAKVQEAYFVTFGKSFKKNAYPAIYIWGQVNNEKGVFMSKDGGTQWYKISDDKNRFSSIRCMVGDLREAGKIYIGTGGRGIFVGSGK